MQNIKTQMEKPLYSLSRLKTKENYSRHIIVKLLKTRFREEIESQPDIKDLSIQRHSNIAGLSQEMMETKTQWNCFKKKKIKSDNLKFYAQEK